MFLFFAAGWCAAFAVAAAFDGRWWAAGICAAFAAVDIALGATR